MEPSLLGHGRLLRTFWLASCTFAGAILRQSTAFRLSKKRRLRSWESYTAPSVEGVHIAEHAPHLLQARGAIEDFYDSVLVEHRETLWAGYCCKLSCC